MSSGDDDWQEVRARSKPQIEDLGPRHADTTPFISARVASEAASPVRVRDPFRSREATGGAPQAIKVPRRAARDESLSLEYRPMNSLATLGTAEGASSSSSLLTASRSTVSLDDVFSQDRQRSLDRRRRPSIERLDMAQELLALQRPATPESKVVKVKEKAVVSSSPSSSENEYESGESLKRTDRTSGDSTAKLNSSSISKYLQSFPGSQRKVVRTVSSSRSLPLLSSASSSPKKARREAPTVEIIHSVETQNSDGTATVTTGSPCSRLRTGSGRVAAALCPSPALGSDCRGGQLCLSMLQVGSRVLCPSEPMSTLTASVDPGDTFLRFTLRHQGSPGSVETSYVTRLSVERIWAYFSTEHSYVDLKLHVPPSRVLSKLFGQEDQDPQTETTDRRGSLVRMTLRAGTTKLAVNMVLSQLRLDLLLTELTRAQEYREDFDQGGATQTGAIGGNPPADGDFYSRLVRRRYYTRSHGSSPSVSGAIEGRRLSRPPHYTEIDGGESPPTLCRSAIPRSEVRPRLLFTYPPETASAHGISITSNELLHLPEGVYLNDSLIDFDLRYMLDHAPPEVADRVHLFSSFFYRKLLSSMERSTDSPSASITKIDVFGKRFSLVPINESLHWYLAILFNDAEDLMVQAEGVGATVATKDMSCRPCIVMFDSLGSRHRRGAVERLKSFLIYEARLKRGVELGRGEIQIIYARMPTQLNLTDCGCFLLEYVERFLAAPETMMAHIMGREDLSTLFAPDDAALRRLRLRQLLEALEADYRQRQEERDGRMDSAVGGGGGGEEGGEVPTASSDVEEIPPPEGGPN